MQRDQFRGRRLALVFSVSVSLFFSFVNFAESQVNSAGIWTHLTNSIAAARGAVRWVQPRKGELFALNSNALQSVAAKIPLNEPAAAAISGTVLELPMPDGNTARFRVVEAPIMEPELAAKFPEIKTYAGQGIDDPEATVRLDVSPVGVHAQVLSPHGAVYVDPAFRGDARLHVSYFKRDFAKADGFHCLTEGSSQTAHGLSDTAGKTAARTLFGTQLRTYRIAVAATGEYTQFFGGTKVNGLAAIITAINRVDGIYETELAVRLVLVGNNDQIVYTNPNIDPYTNTNAYLLLDENQANLDAVIGNANYHIGHVFGTGGGGLASVGSVCISGRKAQGETGSPEPTGDPFYIDYVAHEIGHQFGADHTFNSVTEACSGNREGPQAYEPGSGSTIMSYAGICDPNDLQAHSDAYFHTASLSQIFNFLSTRGGCAAKTSTGNSVPTVNAGANYTIPANTPFVLTATASDANGDALTYCWEERDLGSATSLDDPPQTTGPLFRSLPPSSSPMRYFPRLSDVLANNRWNQEKLPTLARTMNFRVTVRDHRPAGGGVADDDMTVTVAAAGPFVVTSPNTAVSWGGVQTVTWNVAGTTGSGINAANVNIYLSTDGGNTFPYLLATNVPNNGSRNVTLPNLSTTAARIKVQPVGNIFYDVSDVNFTVISNAPLIVNAGFVITSESCQPPNGVVDPYEAITGNWTLKNIGAAPTANLVATLIETNGIYFPSAPMNFGVIPPGGTVTRAFSFTPSGNCAESVDAILSLTDGSADLASVTNTFVLGAIIATNVAGNLTPMTLPAEGIPWVAASPYPSSVTVSGVTGTVVRVTATLNGFSHEYPSDVDVLLVSPDSQSVKLMFDCGGNLPVTGAVLTFDDAAPTALPQSGQIVSGTYRPADYNNPLGDSDFFPSPAPGGGYGSSLNALGASPNGTWSLYVMDQFSSDGGSLNGWSLSIVTSNLLCCATFPAPVFTSTTFSNNAVTISWNAIPGPRYQVQYRTNLALGSWQNLYAPFIGTNTLLKVTDAITNDLMRFYRVLAQP